MKDRRFQLAIVVGTAALVTLFHYLTDPQAGTIHDILQRVYYVPVVLAGLWFGVRGGLVTAVLISIAYYPHARHGWYGPYSFFFQASEMAMYHVIGALCGFLSSKEKQAFEAERRAREEKEAALENLQTRTRELFEMEEQLRRADRLAALGTLSAGLAHEIRNPLGSIRTSGEMLDDLLAEHPIPEGEVDGLPSAPDFVGVIMEESERLNKIVSNFLDFARQEQRTNADESTICDANEAAQRTVELLRPHAEKAGIEIQVTSEAVDTEIRLSSAHFQQILLNLLLNAMEAIEGEGAVTVQLSEHESDVRLMVEDSGPGIEETMADRIFDPFVTTKERGTGLGLSIVHRIVTSHDGEIHLDRTRKPTNRFVVELPKTRSD